MPEIQELTMPQLIEELAEAVHKSYCEYKKERSGEEYWTKGDYNLLDEETKEIDRRTVLAVLDRLKTLHKEKKDAGKRDTGEDSKILAN